MGTESLTDLALEGPAALAARDAGEHRPGTAPWRLALRRLRRNRTALAFGALFVVIAAICLAAPLWAHDVAHTGPYANHIADTVTVRGHVRDVVSPQTGPIGPTWTGHYLLGADQNGRDVAVRLLYGGRTSLEIGLGAALLTMALSVLVGTLAGYVGGWLDALISRTLDVIWPFPVLLLGIALGTALALGGLKIGPIVIAGNSRLIPLLIIAIVYVPYVARPLRGQVLALREQAFVEAARAQGAGPIRIMCTEILPNLASTIVVFLPLMAANAILLEAALSFVGAGVRSPEPSWGSMISDGIERLTSSPHLTIIPGVMLVLAVLALNVLGDGVRDALDPRGAVRIGR